MSSFVEGLLIGWLVRVFASRDYSKHPHAYDPDPLNVSVVTIIMPLDTIYDSKHIFSRT